MLNSHSILFFLFLVLISHLNLTCSTIFIFCFVSHIFSSLFCWNYCFVDWLINWLMYVCRTPLRIGRETLRRRVYNESTEYPSLKINSSKNGKLFRFALSLLISYTRQSVFYIYKLQYLFIHTWWENSSGLHCHY